MQGFQPAARRLAHLPKPQHFADGGAVGFGARGLAGLRDVIPKVQAMGYQQAAPAPSPAPAPADGRAAQLMAMIPQMEAMGFKQQTQRLADGGLVRGPGTGTSDSIPDEAVPGTFIMPADSTEAIGPSALEQMGTVPVKLSDGEFKVPPEQVMALGTAVLKLMKDATHTPVNGNDGGQTEEEVAQARGFQPNAAQRMQEVPEQLFADGGAVQDDLQKRLSQIPVGGPAGWTGGGAPAVQVTTAAPAAPAPAPAAAAPSGGALSRAASIATPAPAAPAVQALSAMPLQDAQPTAQNTDAAQGLARRSAADAMASMPNAPQGFQPPAVRHSGNDWQARNDLRNAQVSASSITNNGGKWDQTGGKNPAALAYQAAVANDNAQRAAEPAAALATMREQGDTQRAGLQVAASKANAAAERMGALDRTLITERGNNTRAGIAALGATEAARLKAQQDGKAPPGYRWTAGGNMEAIPGGPADLKQNKEGVQQGKDTQDIFSILNEARPLLSGATGSYAGVAADKVAQTFGVATDGAKATAQLKALEGALVSKMPKMSGPQSDKDVLLYKQMAGQIGDPTIPIEQRRAAMSTIENLNMKYLPAVTDAAGYDAVPSGSYYRTPSGDVRRKS